MPSTTVVALSGGLDSAVLVARYAVRGNRVVTVTVDYGQRHSREIESAAAIAAHYGTDHHTIGMRDFGQAIRCALTDDRAPIPHNHFEDPIQARTVVPNRNAVLASIAVALGVSAGASVVALGIHAGDYAVYPDCREEFVSALGALTDVANEGFSPPRIEAPFLALPKWEVVMAGVTLGAPLGLTYSCYEGGFRHCGGCGACQERRGAFTKAGVADPTPYAATPVLA